MYSLKISLFHCQFKQKVREKNGLYQMCVFAVNIFLKAWIEAPLPASAPNNDLNLLEAFDNYASINTALSKAVLAKLSSHLWYMSEELVTLAFFDLSVSSLTKMLMARAIWGCKGTEDAPKRQGINPAIVQQLQLSDFVAKRSLSFFEKLHLSTDFLNQNSRHLAS